LFRQKTGIETAMAKNSDKSRSYRTNRDIARRARGKTGLTQTEAAVEWEIGERTIRDIESGKGASAPTLKLFAQKCGLNDWHDLLEEEEENAPAMASTEALPILRTTSLEGKHIEPTVGRAFVSSTFADLCDIRDEVRTSLRRTGYLDIAMEYLCAEDKRPVDRCTTLVRDADVYIGIFAWRYGFIPEGTQLSITELEYQAARQAGKPCIILLLSEEAPWPARLIDADRRAIESLRTRLSKAHVVSFFNGRHDIAARLYESLRSYEQSVGNSTTLEDLREQIDGAFDQIVEAQKDLHGSFRLFDVQRDIRIDQIYVQEILDVSVTKGPYGRLDPMRKRPKTDPIADGPLLAQICSGAIRNRLCAFEGRAGAGKSTMLKMWLLTSLHRFQDKSWDVLPMYFALRDFVDTASGLTWLEETVCRSTPGLRPSLVRMVLDSHSPAALLRRPSFLLLADGFDEMPIEARKRFLNLLAALPPNFHCALTARPGILAETGYPRGSRSYELCDFNNDQVEEYVTRWFAATPAVGSQLLDRIQTNSRLRELASIPLLLACLALHIELNGSFCLSDELVEQELIRTSVEILVERWDAWKDGRTPDLGFIERCCSLFRTITRCQRYENLSWAKLVELAPLLNQDNLFASAFLGRVLKNGRILGGSPEAGFRFSHSIFYDFFLSERLAAGPND
jgi:DNA-binding XRE family transcriptional regulator